MEAAGTRPTLGLSARTLSDARRRETCSASAAFRHVGIFWTLQTVNPRVDVQRGASMADMPVLPTGDYISWYVGRSFLSDEDVRQEMKAEGNWRKLVFLRYCLSSKQLLSRSIKATHSPTYTFTHSHSHSHLFTLIPTHSQTRLSMKTFCHFSFLSS